MNDDKEIELFKKMIDLRQVVEDFGFLLDEKKSSQNSHFYMRDRQKIVLSKQQNRHWTFFSVGEDRAGSIIDFVQMQTGKNLGQVRKYLRTFLSNSAPTLEISFPIARVVSFSSPATEKKLELLEKFQAHAYLLEQRRISFSTLFDPRFDEQICRDKRNNVVFPHRNSAGEIVGGEVKNKFFTGFMRGGRRALWKSNNFSIAETVVVCESAIDCLSYCQIFADDDPDRQRAYISTGGTLSNLQKEMLGQEFSRECRKKIIVATDNDLAGEQLAVSLMSVVPASIACSRHTSERAKDWNEHLQLLCSARA
jgi:5S rRNA maturation endonuclease (ribonuclease M5)